MNIQIYMLTGQNNQEKDILRAYYRGILSHFAKLFLKDEISDINIESKVKEIKKHGVEVNLNYGDKVREGTDVGVIFGSAKPRDNLHHKVRNEVIEKCKKYIIIETPLLERTIVKMSNHDYYRIGLNGFLHKDGEFNNENCPDDRLKSYGALYTDWKGWKQNSNGAILVLLQLPGDASLRNSNHGEWLIESVDRIRELTDRKIILRFHPAMSEKGHEQFLSDIGKIVFKNYKDIEWSDGIEKTLQEDLSVAKVCLTYSSGSAIDSIIYGIPTITIDEGNFAYPICSKTIDSIENPVLADRSTVLQWMSNLAYCQWNRKEMANGKAFNHLYSLLKDMLEETTKE